MMQWLLGGNPAPGGELMWTAPPWLIAVAAAAALLAFGVSLVGKRTTVAARVAEAVFFALALAGLVVALAQPVWLEKDGRVEPGRVAVLMDASASMGVLESGEPRSAAAMRILDGIAGDDVDVFHFGGTLQVGRPDAFDLPATDLESAFEALSDRVAGEKLAGVVVVTDGLDRGLLRKRFLQEGDPVPPDLPGPLTVFQVGSRAELKDLAVRYVDTGGYAYVHAPFTVRAELLGVGFEGRTIRAELLQDGATVRSNDVVIGADGKAEVSFEVRPDRAGRFTYMVQVPTYDGDAVISNNTMPVVVRVVRDKIRVLQVAGSPSWDVKFLRRFLKGDLSVDLVSFFILRTRPDMRRRYANDELSLIEFPYTQLFTEDLTTFDLVIFQNFDHEPFFVTQSKTLLANIKRFVVEDGHAFMMVGGDRSFSLGDYGGTSIDDILPVRISRDKVEADPVPFQAQLTEAGQRHPVTMLVQDPVENAQWWKRLHTLDGTNRITSARPDASVLLTHPTLRDATGAALPVLSVREVGNGRTMALTADTSWRWSLSEAAEGRGNQAYLRFWKGAIRWLIGDPTTRRVRVGTSRENYAVGDEVRVVAHALDANFAPMADANVAMTYSVDGESKTLDALTGPDGEAVFTLPAERRGAHKVGVVVSKDGKDVGLDSTVYAVTNRDPELDEVVPDTDFLRWLAGRTEGSFVGPGERGSVLRDASAGRTVTELRELPIWRAPIVALWVCLFAGLAWIVRRRSGLR